MSLGLIKGVTNFTYFVLELSGKRGSQVRMCQLTEVCFVRSCRPILCPIEMKFGRKA